jgi:hypothetical protein
MYVTTSFFISFPFQENLVKPSPPKRCGVGPDASLIGQLRQWGRP